MTTLPLARPVSRYAPSTTNTFMALLSCNGVLEVLPAPSGACETAASSESGGCVAGLAKLAADQCACREAHDTAQDKPGDGPGRPIAGFTQITNVQRAQDPDAGATKDPTLEPVRAGDLLGYRSAVEAGSTGERRRRRTGVQWHRRESLTGQGRRNEEHGR